MVVESMNLFYRHLLVLGYDLAVINKFFKVPNSHTEMSVERFTLLQLERTYVDRLVSAKFT
jgi:hypothetical protein